MPKRKTEDYEDDDGFVEDAPRSKSGASKKQKQASHNVEANSSGPVSGGGQRGEDGGEFWELSGRRRVQISKFNGKQMISIRDYYEKDGQMLPGKKGISLTIEQFDALVALLPHVETVLKDKGHTLARPEYETAVAGTDVEQDEDEGTGDRNSPGDATDLYGGKSQVKGPVRGDAVVDDVTMKRNFEDTSEDE